MNHFRFTAGVSISLALLLSTFTVAPVFAECFPRPPAGSPILRPYAFTATVRDVTTEVDQQSIDLGEGPGVRWRTTLDVTHVHRGSVPEELVLSGTTSEIGYGGGCTYFLGGRVAVGEDLFIGLDNQIDLRANSGLFGNLLLWRQGDDGWEFHEAALQDGAVPDAYPAAARDARTTAQVLAAIGSLAPDTATAAPSQDRPGDDWTQVAAMIALTLILTLILRAHGPWVPRRDR